MTKISTIGLDLAKNVFQVHGVDASGAVVLGRQLRRAAVEKFFARLPPCLVGMEGCGGAHQWARVISRYGCCCWLNIGRRSILTNGRWSDRSRRRPVAMA